ncbi:DUF6636 domain-containing protein [Pseudoclavibacter helvolus]|uniref:DUF6636 domain-containing protein n=1 Tax=Pseudoclavibacter helvolus TaxID=255205 RepID=UPI003C76788A
MQTSPRHHRRPLTATLATAALLLLSGCASVDEQPGAAPTASVHADDPAQQTANTSGNATDELLTAPPVPGPDGGQAPAGEGGGVSTGTSAEQRTSAPVQARPGDLMVESGTLRFLSPTGNIYCMIGVSPANPRSDQPKTRLESWRPGAEVAACELAVHPDTRPSELRADDNCLHLGQKGGSAVIAGSEMAYGDCRGEPSYMETVELGISPLPAVSVLPYDTSVQYGDYRCKSAYDGMTCANLVTGKGFEVSRDDYELFG